jgi:hypothetical protein
MALQPYLSMLEIHDRAEELTSAPVKRERAGRKGVAADYVLQGIREGAADLGIRRRVTGLRSTSVIHAPARRPSSCPLAPVRLCSVPPTLRPSVLCSGSAPPPAPSSAPALCFVPLASAPRLRALLVCSAHPALCSARLLHPFGPALLRSPRQLSRYISTCPFRSLFACCC